MTDFLAGLGLGEVSADPNDIPTGNYDGIVSESSKVLVKKTDGTDPTFNHVITFKVTDGTHNGAQRQKWHQIGVNPLDANGNPAESVEEVASYTPTMTDQNKQWYKKLFVDLGIPEDELTEERVTTGLVGTPCTFGIKRNGNYINVSYANKRDVVGGSSTSTPVSLGAPENKPANPWD